MVQFSSINLSPATKILHLKMMSAACKCLCQGLILAYNETNSVNPDQQSDLGSHLPTEMF